MTKKIRAHIPKLDMLWKFFSLYYRDSFDLLVPHDYFSEILENMKN